ncbi:alpha/beta fold hydrolase [Longispora fulva]|uniref:Pimeloyl-ACP methyl ester carboxylesterase n=1 Tax=Longispora fulva TaxID=619741 RepID=A0A8J7GB71_9ACTN|nr:alpha/beta fold hydrolase [Longispora fulva]MBG6135410.1 pimeloyl-ACP methyl ester carboxylesterase [Longispora fulva]
MDITARSHEGTFPQLDGVEHRYVELPGLRMHVAEAGRGDPVLLLHGFPEHWWEWRHVIGGLARHHRVICPDLRGAGWTDAPPDGYSSGPLLADVTHLLDALGLDRVHLIAHDWSAIVGFQLCLGHPDRVRDYLVLGGPHPYVRFNVRLLSVMPKLWFQWVIATPGLGPRLLGRGRQRLARHLLTGYAATPDAFTEADIALFLAPLRDPARARAAGKLYRGLILPEARRFMSGAYRDTRLSTRTRILAGAADPVADQATTALLMAGYEDYTDDLTIEFVGGAGHFLADDRPDVVVAKALELFATP